MSTLPNSTTIVDMPFRFLDLKPELRNRIYNFVAMSENTIQVMTKKSEPLDVFIRHGHRTMWDHNLTQMQSNRNRMALLLVSRQLYYEGWSYFYKNLGLDLSYTFLPSTADKLSWLMLLYVRKLNFVRHVEFCFGVARLFLFKSGTDPQTFTEWSLHNFGEDDENAHAIRMLLILRLDLANIETVTIKIGHGGLESSSPSAGHRHLIELLADPASRYILTRNLPKLRDIVLASQYGAERFIKRGDDWELAYTHEKVPEAEGRSADLEEGCSRSHYWPSSAVADRAHAGADGGKESFEELSKVVEWLLSTGAITVDALGIFALIETKASRIQPLSNDLALSSILLGLIRGVMPYRLIYAKALRTRWLRISQG